MAPGMNVVFLIVALFGVGILVLTWLSRMTERDKRRSKRLEILEAALRRGEMDAELKQEVLQVLRSESSSRHGWRHLIFAAGWLGLFAGGALLLFGGYHGHESGWIVLFCSMALVTLPLALRELDTRRTADRGVS